MNKIRKSYAYILMIAVLAAVWLFLLKPLTASAAGFSGGSGSQSDPYKISTRSDLEQLAINVNGGTSYSGKYFLMTGNIDLNGSASNKWTSIGMNDGSDYPFSGIFDGGGHKITGLYLDEPSGYRQGLFGLLLNGGTVKNLGVEGSVTAYYWVGGIAGFNGGRIENCYFSGTVEGFSQYVGGIAGSSCGGTVINCYNTGNISGSWYVGGVSGDVSYSGNIENCINTGTVSGSGSPITSSTSNGATVGNCYYSEDGGKTFTSYDGSERGITSEELSDKLGSDWVYDEELGRPTLSSAPETEPADDPDDLDISKGNIVIEPDGYTVGNKSKVRYTGDYTITGTSNTNSITVSGTGINVTVKNLNIDLSSVRDGCPFAIESGSCDLTIEGTNTLISGSYQAAVKVETGRTITIGGTGSLVAKSGGMYGSGIGGSDNNGGGTINIRSGKITATGSLGCAGIGGNYKSSVESITISGGEVTATGGMYAAAIGGGGYGDGGNITITGGKVTATGDTFGAGIGGGNADGGNITITGGEVTATGGSSGAGIGGGLDGNGGNITITGGTIYAAGGTSGAGIGSGSISNGGLSSDYETPVDKSGGTINISGGTIEAHGGSSGGAGIGGGKYASGGNITITDGNITAAAGKSYSEDIVAQDIGYGASYYDYENAKEAVIIGGTVNGVSYTADSGNTGSGSGSTGDDSGSAGGGSSGSGQGGSVAKVSGKDVKTAGSTNYKISAVLVAPVINVTIPSSISAVINPYGVAVKTSSGADYGADGVISPVYTIRNKTQTNAVAVNAEVYMTVPKNKDGEPLIKVCETPDGVKDQTGKALSAYLLASVSENGVADADSEKKDLIEANDVQFEAGKTIVFSDATSDSENINDGTLMTIPKANYKDDALKDYYYGHFRIGGAATDRSTGKWGSSDKISLVIVFNIVPCPDPQLQD